LGAQDETGLEEYAEALCISKEDADAIEAAARDSDDEESVDLFLC
jgi:hypothetical protein